MRHSGEIACPSAELAEGSQRILGDPREIWRVTRGHVLVYAALSDQSSLMGPPRYVATCRAGQAVFGGTAYDDATGLRLSVLIAAGEPATITRLDTPEGPGPTAEDASEWALTLCRDMVAWASEAPVQTSEMRDIITAPQGGAFRARSTELTLMQVTRGQAMLAGVAPALWIEGDGPIAVNSAAWFTAGPDGADVSVSATGGGVDLDVLTSASRRTTGLWLRAALAITCEERERERQRLARARVRRSAKEREAIEALRFAGGDAAMLGSLPDDPLAAALEIIGREMAVEFDTTAVADESRSLWERIERAADLSEVRARRVDLTGPWLEGDAGVLLAFSSAGLPRVFIPRLRRLGMKFEYRMIFPESGKSRVATPDDVLDLEEKGVAFHAPLPREGDGQGADFWRIAGFALKPQLADMRQVMLLTIMVMLLGIMVPIAHFVIIDKVVPNDQRGLLFGVAVAAAGLTLCTFTFSLAQAFVNLRVQSKIFTRMQGAIIDRMIRLPNRFFRGIPTGELLKRALMITDVSVGMVSTLSAAISALVGMLLMLIVCFYYSSKLAWIAVIAALASAAVSVTTSYLMRRRNVEMQLEGGRNLGFLMQIIQGVGKLQSARSEEYAFSRWAKGRGDILRMEYANARLEYNASMLGTTVRTAATIALFYVAGSLVLETEIAQAIDPLAEPLLTIGVFFAFQRAFTSVIDFIGRFFSTFVDAHEQFLKRELVRPILEAPIEQKRDRVDPGRLQGRIELRSVTFRYLEDGPLVLDNVDIDAHDGEFVAIVGPSGAGKSTVMSLILEFETPQGGTVLIDGRPVASIDMRAVRRQVGVVLQNDHIPGGSIYQAIAGASSITFEQAWLAARDAGLEPDIKAMPMGMHSLLPEGGVTLSGGQRQRLAIARALAQDPRVMLFDEATSALDNVSQAIVSESLRRRRVTRIVIAHRLSTVAQADRIFVLSRGRVVETGTAEELRAAGGLFARLSRSQEAGDV